MQSYVELTPPTAVTHSLSFPFLSATANNLILVKTSLLQIFSLKAITTYTAPDTTRDGPPSAGLSGQLSSNLVLDGGQRGERIQSTRLVLIAQYELCGTVTSLARVRIAASRSGGQALLLAFRDAKLSLVEWDPERYSISTISIHYYEQEDIQTSPWDPPLSQSINYLSVDPRSRCAALKFGARHLAILPFYQEGDDLVMDDLDSETEGGLPTRAIDEPSQLDKAPYAPSFVLSLMALDPSLSHPVHLAFLNEYRDPTFGILSSEINTSSALLRDRRDTLSYNVFTLDLEQRASTTLLSVNNLPYDLFRVYPLQLPVGGALLIGGNELIHVDQSGKTNGVAVNPLAKHSTSFGMLDQSSLGLRLEDCVIEKMGSDHGDMLIVLNDGGYEVNGLERLLGGASTASIVGRGRIFVGSEDADSVILGWSRKSDKLKRQRSRLDLGLELAEGISEIDEDYLEDEEDDLYASTKPAEKAKSLSAPLSTANEEQEYAFRIHDTLDNFGPIKDISLGALTPNNVAEGSNQHGREIVISSGRDRAGSLSSFNHKLALQVSQFFDIENVVDIWTVTTISSSGSHMKGSDAEYHNYAIANIQQDSGTISSLYSISATNMDHLSGTEFDNGEAGELGTSIDICTLNGGTRVVQVLHRELRIFDADFNVAQLLPLMDDVSESAPKVVNSSFVEPFILLTMDDCTIHIASLDESGDLELLEQGERLLSGKWLSGSLYDDTNDIFRLQYDDADDEEEAGNVLMFLLSNAGGLHVYRLPNLRKPVYVAEGLSFVPPFLSREFTVRRSTAREALTELIVTDLGDSTHKAPYLLLRTAKLDLVIYQPYQGFKEDTSPITLRFLKIANPNIPPVRADLDTEIGRQRPLRAISDLGGYSTVYIAGPSPALILKSASSTPKIIPVGNSGIRALCGLHTATCEKGALYVNEDASVTAATLPVHSHYTTGWVTRKIDIGEQVEAIDYQSSTEIYVLGTSRKVNYKLSDDETWAAEDTSFLPQIEQGSIRLLDRKTWSFIDRRDLDIGEVIMSIKIMSLETSEHTHERRSLVVVGTAIIRGEDLPAIGRIYVFDINDVVPEPDRPETGKKLKLIAREEVKGAVTALTEIGTQGFLLAAQGQKCMVRGLKEDGSLLPVAFMDMQCYVSAAKELKGTGLCVMGDAIKGIWFAGYTEDPYQLRLFGKSSKHIEVLAADFLPDGKQLYVVAADSDCNIHVLQFDPENPKSLSGSHLLPLSTFHTGHFPTTLTLLPASPSSPRSLLLTTQSGALALISPLPPSSHRTLSALQSHLQTALPHAAGLNPKIYRHAGDVESLVGGGGYGAGGRGGVIDGMVVRRWNEGGSWRRWGDEGSVREVVRGVLGDDLGF
ncbi:protein CFT1 [Physcia stellaris]|nr:protein CFT1 [Physcia stellaris]